MHRDFSESSDFNDPVSLSTSLPKNELALRGGVPVLIVRAGDDAVRRFVEFFVATIRNQNTRAAYAQAVGQFFGWCQARQLALDTIQPVVVATYVENLSRIRSAPTVKQHLAALRMLFDWLVIGQIVPINPAWSVKGPRHVVKKGKTPVLTAAEARQLLDAIDTSTMMGLRDRALIGVMVFSFARVSAVVNMNVEDFYQQGRRAWFRLHEKNGKFHEVPVHHTAAEYLDAYLHRTAIADEKKKALFRSMIGKRGMLSTSRLSRMDALRMVKRRALSAGIAADRICCHTFRATGITAYLENGGTLEHAQAIAAHESPRTTKLYDRTSDVISLDEIERITI